jgi:hypothetical protein
MKAKIALIKAAEILGFNSDNHYLSKSWPELLAAKTIIKLQGDSEISLNLIKNAIDDGVIHKQYKNTDYLASSNPTISASDFIALLKEINIEPSETIKAWYESTLPQTEAVGDAETGSHAGTESNGRRNNQIDLICKIAIQLGYVDLMAIPEGGKAAIKIECLKITNLFTPDGFKHAWKEANKRKLISMQDKEKYL